jgi:AcrR family transcriptional regulator
MPYPSQTNAKEIHCAALDLLEKYGEEKVTIRGVAKCLGLSPNAIYRYYKNRDALLAELASEGVNVLNNKIHEATSGMKDTEALFTLADCYVEFALKHQSLYKLIMRSHDYTPEQEKNFHILWSFVRERVGHVIGNTDEAAVALWAFLHGMIGLEQADVFHEGKPQTGIRPGMEALLAGFETRK